ncbi:zeta toxin family protein [Enterococcus sp. 5B7_DIV0075]|nr:zeta toxin family protein [Enterococcus sp. 5B7_DIV0075]
MTALNGNLCVIDADKFRELFPGYAGNNSDEFQRGSALLVDAALDLVLKKGYSFILDGTFATSKVNQNIERALKKNYNVLVYYVYQDPFIAWDFTKKREEVEGRFVPKERFINAFFQSRKNLMQVKKQFQEKVTINILVKDFQNTISDFLMDIDNVELALPISYTKERLEEELHD